MLRSLTLFTVSLAFFLAIVFLLHISSLHFLSLPLYDNKIIFSYSINYLLALLIFTTLILLKNKFTSIFGFIFMAGSSLKFIVFFTLFYPSFKTDGILTRLEFTSFFTPYAFCLAIEVIFLIKILKD